MPPDPSKGLCPLGTHNTPAAYFKNLADFFQIYREEHCLRVVSKSDKYLRCFDAVFQRPN